MAALCAASLAAGTALAFGPAGKDPAHNFKIGRLPLACQTAPSARACIDGVVYWLDRARASLHQGPYKLPVAFATMSPAKQVFILVNLDRVHYGLTPIAGLSRQLDRWAMAGVLGDRDPVSGDPRFVSLGDWAGGFPDILVAYAGWVYADGYGSANLDCTSPHAAGCWGHRHAVLWSFGPGGRLAMGAAAGHDRRGTNGFTLLVGSWAAGAHPAYYYTWSQAVAAGAGRHTYVVHRPPSLDLALQAHGLQLTALIEAPSGARCQLGRSSHGHWVSTPWVPCSSGALTLTEPSAGRYRFRLRANGRVLTRYVTLRRG